MRTHDIPVLIRVEPNGPDHPGSFGEVIAFFPTEVGSTNDPRTMMCFSPSEGHSSCSFDYAFEKTKPASIEDRDKMLRRLEKIGYKNLRAVSLLQAREITDNQVFDRKYLRFRHR